MNNILLFLTVVSSYTSFAEVKTLDLDVKSIKDNRDYFFPNDKYWQYEIDLRWSVEKDRFFWDNNVNGMTKDDRFGSVSWRFDLGFKIVDEVDAIYSHRSQHKTDEYSQRFPLYNSFGLRFHFMK